MKLIQDNRATPYSAVFLIIASFAAVLILSSVVVPDPIAAMRPDFVVMMLIFWCWHRPELVGIAAAFAVGLISDVMHFVLLGENALSNVLVVYLALLWAKRIERSTQLARFVAVALLLTVDAAVGSLLQAGMHGFVAPAAVWLAPVIGAALWVTIAAAGRGFARG